MGTLIWMKPGEDQVVEERETAPSTQELRDFVGGYIELVRVLDANQQPQQMIVNDEGHLIGLPLNPDATRHYWRASLLRGMKPTVPIAGPAVLLQGADVHLD